MSKRVNLILVLFFTLFVFGVLSERISEKICRETSSSITNVPTPQNSDSQKDLGLGKVSTVPGEFPYMVALGWKNEEGSYDFFCGGVLIWPQYVLSAAHCAQNREGVAPQIVRIGGGNLLDNTVENVAITEISVHPEYKRNKVYNDIAILKIASPSSQPPACLWQTPEINQSEVTAIGYGKTSIGGDASRDLLKVNLNIISNDVCRKHFEPMNRVEQGIIDSHLCIGDLIGNKDTCAGDAGGPAIVKLKENDKEISHVVGIVSFGRACGVSSPTVTTRVSSFIDWIESVVSK